MRRLALTSLFLSALSPLAQTVLDPTALYVSDPLRWERGKRPGEPAPELAFAEILVLEPSGDLAILSCYLNRSPDNRLDILYQSGFSLCSGTWEKADGHLVARFRSVHTSERKVGETGGALREESWSYAPPRDGVRVAEWIKIGGTRYIPLRDLNDIERLAQIIQFYRKEAEAQ